MLFIGPPDFFWKSPSGRLRHPTLPGVGCQRSTADSRHRQI